MTTTTAPSPLADLALWLSEQTWSGFAQSLAEDFRRRGSLTERQIAAAVSMRNKCQARAAARKVATEVVAPQADVPAGHFAIVSQTGNNDLDFYRVDRPTEGRWEGYTFVKRIIGGRDDIPVRGAEARRVLAAIAAAGAESAMALYGREIGRCGRCHRHLTDDESRAVGLGPHCRNML